MTEGERLRGGGGVPAGESPGAGWTLRRVADAAGGRLTSGPADELAIRYEQINTDTRKLRPGDLFVALRGETHDGHDHLASAWDRGAAAALVDRPDERLPMPQIVVDDSLRGLQRWAAAHRAALPRLAVLGLTGSSGKTTAKDLAAHLLAGAGPVWSTPGNLNNHVGVPLTLLGLSAEHRYAVIEMGMNHPGEIEVLTRLARPDAALITDIGTAHIGHLGSREAVLSAKLEILAGLAPGAPLVLPHDPWVLERLPQAARSHPLRTFGLDPQAGWHPVGSVESSLEGTRFATTRTGPTGVPLLGGGALLSTLAALAAVEAIGADPAALAPRLALAARRPMRMEPRRYGETAWILDCYNASPESTLLALVFLREVPHAGRRVLVLGALGELGAHSEAIHQDLGRRTGAIPVVLFVGEDARAAMAANRALALSSEVADWVPDAEAAAEWLRPRLRAGDLVLLKGSRRMALERIVERLYPGTAPSPGGADAAEPSDRRGDAASGPARGHGG